jgi:flavin-dependent dehydrogenase
MGFVASVHKDCNRIGSGSKVAIIGGGPAGSFFALYLLSYAKERGIQPDITIYEERNFDELGRKGCKGCAGIVSTSLLRNLTELDLSVPEEVIQSKIEHYSVHSSHTSISISNPEKGEQIFSIYRGGGPRESHFENRISFNGWLLRQTQTRGVKVENQRVSRILFEQQAMVEVGDKELGYDIVVLASGVNAKAVPIQGVEYIPPKTQIMAQDELYAGNVQVESRLGNVAHAFLIPHSGVIFGTLVPKGAFINVSVLSSIKRPVSVTDFLSHDIVRSILPDRYERACGCRPHAVIGFARNYYADRFVAIGDAAVSRLYKDGIGSSLLSAREAARIIVHHGLSRQDFQRHYQPLCKAIYSDNGWGRLLFFINDKVKDSRAFLLTQHRLIGDEQGKGINSQAFTKAAWGMFTGSYSYESITSLAFRPVSLAKFSVALFKEILNGWFHRSAHYRKLHVGSTKD